MSKINEQEMRIYLLGGLTSERRAEIEALAQADENLREEILALEEELVEQYLAGLLTEEESRSFEAHLLTTERGQQKLHFAQLFERYRNSNPAVEPPVHRVPAPNNPPIPTSSPLFATFYRNPTFAVLSLIVGGLLITLVGWMMVAPSQRTSIAEEVPGNPVEVTLAPDSNRSGTSTNRLTAPAKNVQVKLMLELTKTDFTKYKMQLFRANEKLETQDELKTESRDTHYFIPVVVTSEKLTPGEYQLKLCGVPESGQPASIDYYSFRVTEADAQDDQRFTR
jgi:hypothetical protein